MATIQLPAELLRGVSQLLKATVGAQAVHVALEQPGQVRRVVWRDGDPGPEQVLSAASQTCPAGVVVEVRCWGATPVGEGILGIAATTLMGGFPSGSSAEPPVPEQEVLFRAIFETSQDAIGVSSYGTHTLVNPAYLEMFGYTHPSELVGTPILTLIDPAEHDRVLALIRQRGEGLPVPTRYETRGVRRDGVVFEMEVHASAYQLAGRVYTLVILRDVSRQKKADAARRDSEAFYKAMFDINTAVKLLIDPASGLVVDANAAAAEFYGHPLDTLRGMSINAINTLPEAEVAKEMLAAQRQHRGYFNFKHRLANGDIRDVEVYSGPIQHQEQRLLLSIIHDVTDRKRLEEQYRHAQKMEAVGRLAGGIAHDFNNILTALIGYGVMTLEDLDPGHPGRSNVEHMVRNAQRAEQLTRQLLTFSRPQATAAGPVDLNGVVSGVQSLVQRLLGEDVVVALAPHPAPCVVNANTGQLEQVVMNLAVNARDAMPQGGKLTITTRQVELEAPLGTLAPGRYAVLSVQDTGHGMDESTRARVFEPFFTTKPAGRGTGLGLATAYSIITQAGGSITVESSPGQGAAFTIHLPLLSAPAALPALEAMQARATSTASRTIMVVEDHDDVRRFMVLGLKAAGHTVHEFPGGVEALAWSAVHGVAVDLLVTDVVMPGPSGPAVFAALVAQRPSLKVLYVSGYTDGHVAEMGVDNAQSAFLAKPFTGRQLAARVALLLELPPQPHRA